MARPIRLLAPLALPLAALALQCVSAQEPSPSPSAPPPQASPSPKAQPVAPPPPPPPAPVQAHPTPPPPSVRPEKPRRPREMKRGPKEWDQSAFLENLNPEQRKKFQQNLQRWKSLPPEQRSELRRNEEFRRKRILKEINDAITQSGLKLDEEQRQLFTYKFAEERRTIEENLRQEMEKKRRNAVDQLIKQLVAEFQTMPPGRVGAPPPPPPPPPPARKVEKPAATPPPPSPAPTPKVEKPAVTASPSEGPGEKH